MAPQSAFAVKSQAPLCENTLPHAAHSVKAL